MLRIAFIAASFVSAIAPAAAANLIVNGGFEAAGASGTVPAGWTLNTGPEPRSALRLDGNFFAPFGLTGTQTALDNHFLVLGAYDTPVSDGIITYPVSVEQSFKTVAGVLYTFSYAVAQFGSSPQYAAIDFYDADRNTLALDGLNTAPGSDADSMFTTRSGSFYGSGDMTTVRLRDYGSTYSTDAFFDNIVVTAAGVAAVPEPSTWMMLLCGFGLLGSALRRRAPRLVRA